MSHVKHTFLLIIFNTFFFTASASATVFDVNLAESNHFSSNFQNTSSGLFIGVTDAFGTFDDATGELDVTVNVTVPGWRVEFDGFLNFDENSGELVSMASLETNWFKPTGIYNFSSYTTYLAPALNGSSTPNRFFDGVLQLWGSDFNSALNGEGGFATNLEFELTPTPLPSSLFFLGTALALFGLVKSRKSKRVD